MKISSTLLLNYFDLASRELQALIDSRHDEIPPQSEVTLDWHRSRIMRAQMTALDEVLLDGMDLNRDHVQIVLRQIGEGDFSCVTFDVTDVTKEENELRLMMEKTNDIARKAFSHSILYAEWKYDHLNQNVQSRKLKCEGNLDKASILEYCALSTSAVRLESVQRFVESGENMFPVLNVTASSILVEDSVNGRLENVQALIWHALGWDAVFASSQLRQMLSDGNQNNNPLLTDATVDETLTKYASAMTVAMNNVTQLQHSDDGTTRVINVSYSEKIVTVPQNMNNEDTTIASLSAPTSNAIHEHSAVQQRQQLDIAQKTSMLQQQIWDEFEALPSSEQANTLQRAETAQREFLERVMNAPPGPERVLLMQSLSGEDQKLLVLHKLWIAQNTARR